MWQDVGFFSYTHRQVCTTPKWIPSYFEKEIFLRWEKTILVTIELKQKCFTSKFKNYLPTFIERFNYLYYYFIKNEEKNRFQIDVLVIKKVLLLCSFVYDSNGYFRIGFIT